MALSLLFEGRFEEYHRAVADQGTQLWIFLHVPKTAGSSFRAELAYALQPQVNVFVDHYDRSVPVSQQMNEVFERFVGEAGPKGLRFASGHFNNTHILFALPRLQACDPRFITVLRDPVERVISDYCYQRTPAHPPYESFKQKFPTFRDYYLHSKNGLCRYLAPDRTKVSAQSAIDFLMQTYSFVGAVELYPMTVRSVFAFLGFEHRPLLYLRRTKDLTSEQVEVTEEDRQAVRELNAKDVELYDYFITRLRAVQQGWLDYLSSLPLAPFKYPETAQAV